MHELFKWDPDALNTSETQLLIKQQHAAQLRDLQRQQPPALTSHVCWVEEQPLCAGTSQHGLLFSLEDPEGKDLNLSMAAAGSGLSGSSAGSSGRRFPDSGWHPRKGRSQQAGGSGSGNGGQQGQRLRGHPDGGAAGGGGSGSSGGGLQPSAAVLDEMMQSLHIGGGGSRGGLSATAAVAATGGRGAGGWPPQQQQQSQKVQELTKRIKQLQAQLQSSSDDLQQLGPRLPDGGAKVRREVEWEVLTCWQSWCEADGVLELCFLLFRYQGSPAATLNPCLFLYIAVVLPLASMSLARHPVFLSLRRRLLRAWRACKQHCVRHKQS